MKTRFIPGLVWLLVCSCFAAPPPAARATGRPTVVLISGEFEYTSMITLPAFKNYLETKHGLRCVYLERTAQEDIPGLEAVDKADLVILCVRRMTLPEAQLNRFKQYLDSGRPLIGIRTASHAFENWKEWDNEVLGGNYHGHHGNKLVATARVNPSAQGHPILKGVAAEFVTSGSLYKNSPLKTPDAPLLIGTVEGQPPEPMAWTHRYHGARIFYTSLGDPGDFPSQPFMQMMVNAVFWALDKPAPATAATPITAFATKQIDVGRFESLANHRKFTVIDARSAEAFAGGHVARAINLDASAPDFAAKLAKLDKNEPLVVYARSADDSARIVNQLQQIGFKFVYDFPGGMEDWEKAGKKIAK